MGVGKHHWSDQDQTPGPQLTVDEHNVKPFLAQSQSPSQPGARIPFTLYHLLLRMRATEPVKLLTIVIIKVQCGVPHCALLLSHDFGFISCSITTYDMIMDQTPTVGNRGIRPHTYSVHVKLTQRHRHDNGTSTHQFRKPEQALTFGRPSHFITTVHQSRLYRTALFWTQLSIQYSVLRTMA
ncbi:hypothetical protein VFPPC_01405 [Pochonia chlamydosporia 170]|uniref:Uncharacterized protein n=1 Tax=Pochonia chlamydosporia 170 TaxID=1380566 RepID=A0A179G7K3_METCM|nr:hypothetical protein VFPPC_01405 [Pochonia chlamydosporia 170]OAQ73774.1 hypothetical protein VFPPC_01405 [Pochonia chlamydosporia 170]